MTKLPHPVLTTTKFHREFNKEKPIVWQNNRQIGFIEFPFILTQMKGFGRMNFDDILAKLYQTTNLLQALDDELSLTLDHVGTRSLTTEEALAIAYEIHRDKDTIQTLLAVAKSGVIDSTKQLSAYDEVKGGGDNA